MESSDTDYSDLRTLWETYCSIHAENDLDIRAMWHRWAKEQRDSLREWSAETSFDALCENGCAALPLAITVASYQPLSALEKKWRLVVGPPRERDQKIRVLEKAATVLQELQISYADAVASDQKDLLHPEVLEWFRRELISPSHLDVRWPKNATAPHPATVVRSLRRYASCLRMFEAIGDESHVGSTDTLSRYFVSAYVKRATGAFHDAEVSALIGAGLRTSYDETAHRVWRSRNYDRIDTQLSGLVEMLFGFGVVSSAHT